jgi:hypothetical protein
VEANATRGHGGAEPTTALRVKQRQLRRKYFGWASSSDWAVASVTWHCENRYSGVGFVVATPQNFNPSRSYFRYNTCTPFWLSLRPSLSGNPAGACPVLPAVSSECPRLQASSRLVIREVGGRTGTCVCLYTRLTNSALVVSCCVAIVEKHNRCDRMGQRAAVTRHSGTEGASSCTRVRRALSGLVSSFVWP